MNKSKSKKISGAEIVIEALLHEGVDTVFGYPGGQVIDIYDALWKKKNKIRHYITAHEQGAAHAADGYARASGKVGVVIATSGPGASNLVTGIATAYLDSIPMVAITGNVDTSQIGRDSFQELDIADITMPITKHNYIVKDVSKLQYILAEAFEIARSGRQGPVLVDIPKDVQIAKTELLPFPEFPEKLHSINENELLEAVKYIEEAKRPIIYCGGGAVSANVSELITELSEKIDAPIGCSLMGLSAVSDNNPRKLGLTGIHGRSYATRAVAEADVIIAIGARFTDRATGAKGELVERAKIVQLDIDPAEIDKNVTDAAYIIGDLKLSLSLLLEKLTKQSRSEWNAKINKSKNFTPSDIDSFTPFSIIDTVSKYAVGRRVVTDVGQHQMWVAQRYPLTKPKGLLTSGGLGTMGFGMGAAIGASLADNSAPILLFTGDGSFGMNLNELATAVTYKIPLLVIIMNNRSLGMVKQFRQNSTKYNYAELNRSTDFVKLSEAFGAKGARASSIPELESILSEIVGKDLNSPLVIECIIDSNETVSTAN